MLPARGTAPPQRDQKRQKTTEEGTQDYQDTVTLNLTQLRTVMSEIIDEKMRDPIESLKSEIAHLRKDLTDNFLQRNAQMQFRLVQVETKVEQLEIKAVDDAVQELSGERVSHDLSQEAVDLAKVPMQLRRTAVISGFWPDCLKSDRETLARQLIETHAKSKVVESIWAPGNRGKFAFVTFQKACDTWAFIELCRVRPEEGDGRWLKVCIERTKEERSRGIHCDHRRLSNRKKTDYSRALQ